ncbi:helix-turn-helix domain-containing protein [Ktedonospora formicarum]|uniref:helix-turn-helix domain-containing protein n=1 Tax=Ktedonospora formicarum TaxID=2778364 RepID=UPI001C68C7DD|nr:helix-turn-helix domain-containing protein [Ktedonospora formicarum]
MPSKSPLSQAKREERLARYQQVVNLREQGFSQTTIAAQVGIGHATVSRWLRNGTFPEQQPRSRKTSVDSHLSQFVERVEAGSYRVAQLRRDLVAEGYGVSLSIMASLKQMVLMVRYYFICQGMRHVGLAYCAERPASRCDRPASV